MAYTQNESIDWLDAITPTMDDLVITMDQAEVGVAKTSTLSSIYNLFKTTYDTFYAKYLWDADFYQYSISRTVASGNLTVSLLNFEWNTPTATKPVKKMINGVVYTITSALSVTIASWVNWYNAWSAELSTKEIDYFTYIGRKSSTWAFFLIPSRISTAVKNTDLSFSIANEKFGYGADNLDTWDEVVNIGRFNAILSGGAGYTWSIPTASNLIQRPIYMNTPKDFVPTITAGTSTGITSVFAKYEINGKKVHCEGQINISSPQTTINTVTITLPFTSQNQIAYATYLIDNSVDVSSTWFVNFAILSFRKIGNFNWFLVMRYSADYVI